MFKFKLFYCHNLQVRGTVSTLFSFPLQYSFSFQLLKSYPSVKILPFIPFSHSPYPDTTLSTIRYVCVCEFVLVCVSSPGLLPEFCNSVNSIRLATDKALPPFPFIYPPPVPSCNFETSPFKTCDCLTPIPPVPLNDLLKAVGAFFL